MTKQTKFGFSLIELSLVILVIGILVIGITKGSRIIAEAKIKVARSLTNSSPVNSTSNLVLWIDSTSIKSFDTGIADNLEVTNWYDINSQSVSKNNFTQNTTDQYPLYKAELFNGLPGVLFDGVDDWMSTPHNITLNPNEGGFTVFCVSKILDTSSVGHYFSKGNGNSTTLGYSYIYRMLRFFTSDTTSGGSSNTFPAVLPDITPKIATITFSGTEAKYYKNNSEQTPSSSYTGSINSTSDFTIGSRSGGSSNSNVEIYELIIFNRQLKSVEISNIHKYLGQKWGISLS